MGRPRKTPVIEAAEVVEVEAVESADTWGDNANAVLDTLVSTDPAEEPATVASANTITNINKGTTLHLGDGRKIGFGESADVPADIAELLRATGQAE